MDDGDDEQEVLVGEGRESEWGFVGGEGDAEGWQ